MPVQYIDVPPITRRHRESRYIDEPLVLEFARLLEDDEAVGRWVSHGEPIPDKKTAYSYVNAYRKTLAKQLGVDEKDLHSRVWEQEGQYRFALQRLAR